MISIGIPEVAKIAVYLLPFILVFPVWWLIMWFATKATLSSDSKTSFLSISSTIVSSVSSYWPLYVLIYSTLNPNTFLSKIASLIRYWCRQSPKTSAVVLLSWDLFSLNRGVPVKPKYCPLVKNFLIFPCIFPNWLLWHSSKIKITFSSLYCSIIFWYLGFFIALVIFWIVVIMSFLFLSCTCSTSLSVRSVISTQSAS